MSRIDNVALGTINLRVLVFTLVGEIMTVKKMLQILNKMPQDFEIWHVWDGAARGTVDSVWQTPDNRVIVSHSEEPIYYSEDRPFCAPTVEEDKCWSPGDEE